MERQNKIIQRKNNSPLGCRLFSFGVMADSHLNPDEDICNAPFEVNRLANGRMRQVVRELNQQNLAFVIHLGDLIHPVPAVPDLYADAARRFHEQVADLTHPLYLVPGNHDVGDKPLDWSPACEVSDAHIDLWLQTFGKHYYAFDHGNCHFVTVNAQIINTGLSCEAEQKQWLEQDLSENTGKRIFISIHYPPYLYKRDEQEHYDNINEPGRSWLLKLMESSGAEVLFGGHVHNFWYLRHQNTDCYLLPSTAFVRQDYSEMLKATPPPEFEAGRNDAPKLGYFIVHIYENGHVCHFVRTYGRTADPESVPLKAAKKVSPLSPRENAIAPLGFDLRESWAESVGIPPSGGLDEFDRKAVRNDYPLLALWEMGVRKLRIPIQDLKDPDTCQRMRELAHHGHEFTLFSYGIPGEMDFSRIMDNRDILVSWEIGFAWPDLETLTPFIRDAAQKTGIPLYLSKLWSHADAQTSDEPYYHVINHGFLPTEADAIAKIHQHPDLAKILKGVVFRVSHKDSVWDVIHQAASICGGMGLKASMHLRMTGNNPAEATCNDLWTANRLAEALAAARCHDNISVFSDTLVDIDRGYFVRNGVIDQLCNPRLGAWVVGHLYGALNTGPDKLSADRKTTHDQGTCLTLVNQQESHLLFLPDEAVSKMEIPIPEHWAESGSTLFQTNLGTGEIVKISIGETPDLKPAVNIKALAPVPVLLTCSA